MAQEKTSHTYQTPKYPIKLGWHNTLALQSTLRPHLLNHWFIFHIFPSIWLTRPPSKDTNLRLNEERRDYFARVRACACACVCVCMHDMLQIHYKLWFSQNDVSMYRGCPSWNCPWNRASNSAHQKVGSMSQPRGYHRSRFTHAGSYSHTWVCFL